MAIFDHFPPSQVVVVRNPGTAEEVRRASHAILMPEMATFNIDEPIYEGDVVEMPDPRGGVLRRTVRKVDILQSPFDNDLDHIEAHF